MITSYSRWGESSERSECITAALWRILSVAENDHFRSADAGRDAAWLKFSLGAYLLKDLQSLFWPLMSQSGVNVGQLFPGLDASDSGIFVSQISQDSPSLWRPVPTDLATSNNQCSQHLLKTYNVPWIRIVQEHSLKTVVTTHDRHISQMSANDKHLAKQ